MISSAWTYGRVRTGESAGRADIGLYKANGDTGRMQGDRWGRWRGGDSRAHTLRLM